MLGCVQCVRGGRMRECFDGECLKAGNVLRVSGVSCRGKCLQTEGMFWGERSVSER